jgi:hypothetical protein
MRSVPFASAALMRFWDTGLRPFSTQLITWANTLRGGAAFTAIKASAIALMRRVLLPLTADVTCDADAAFRVMVARKEERT